MKIAFYAGQCLPVHAYSIEERPLGGTETGLIRLAEILARRGHDVFVFTAHTDPPPSEPPYLPARQIFSSGPFDLLVMIKEWMPAYFGVRADRRFFWTGDGYDQYVNYGLGDLRVIERIDRFLTVSSWQAQSVCDASGFPIEKTFFIGNGVYLPYFSGNEERNLMRLIFASAPYRGLEVATRGFIELKKSFPELELHIFSGFDIYNTDRAYQGPQVAEFRRLEAQLRSLPGVKLHGNQTQRVLSREFMRSGLLFYPNTIFETCCIVAMEAEAGGCPIVASRNSALPETVADCGVLIDGQPGSKDYMHELIEKTASILGSKTTWEKLSKRCLARAETELSWERVADRFEKSLI